MRYVTLRKLEQVQCTDESGPSCPRRHPISCPTWISLLISPPILPFLLPFRLALADSVNVTVDDTSSLIVYSPASSWHASSVPCSTCLAPSSSIALQGTWHDGTHIIPTVDADDLPNNAVSPSPTPSPSAGGDGDKGKKKGGDDDDKKDGDDSDSDDDESDGGNGKRDLGGRHRWRRRRRRPRFLPRQDSSSDASSNPFFTPNLDSDDAGFVDTPVSAQLSFTGTSFH